MPTTHPLHEKFMRDIKEFLDRTEQLGKVRRFLLLMAAACLLARPALAAVDCAEAVKVPISAADIAPAPKGCSSRNLYYGIGVARDYQAARACAFAERHRDGEDKYDAAHRSEMHDIGGSGVLAMLYANGFGVHRNLALATRFACEYGGAATEMDGRLGALAALAADPAKAPFDLCTDAESGFMTGACSSLYADRKRAEGEAWLDRLAASLPEAARPPFAKLRKAAGIYIDTHAQAEIDQSGTLRFAIASDERDHLRAAFLAVLRDLRKGALAAPADFATADQALNHAYGAAMTTIAGLSPDIGVSKGGVRHTELAWLAYRDAFVAFAAQAFPGVPADSLKARLSRERTAVLGNIPASE